MSVQEELPSGCKEPLSDQEAEEFATDTFQMFYFKVRRCTKTRAHDWTECPYAHPGEKAMRRDPRLHDYVGTACPDYRRGGCRRGDSCGLAHGVFEAWLHPSRYRTQHCKDGLGCTRRVCFFAHMPGELRVGTTAKVAAVAAGLPPTTSAPSGSKPEHDSGLTAGTRRAASLDGVPPLGDTSRYGPPRSSFEAYHPRAIPASAVDEQQWLPLKQAGVMQLGASFQHLGLVEGVLDDDDNSLSRKAR